MQTPLGLILTAASTSAQFWYAKHEASVPVPAKYYDQTVHSAYDFRDGLPRNPYYNVRSQADELLERLFILQRFSTRLLSVSAEADPEIAKVVNEHFWDLL